MIKTGDEKKCCGCRACEEACPRHCISMRRGSLGHLIASIDTSSCISCNICLSVCPIQNNSLNRGNLSEAYVSFNKEENVRKISSSGGMFYTFASYFLQNEGYSVFGSRFDEGLVLKTVGVDAINDLPSLCKSKYVQSDTNGVYRKIEMILNEGKGVVYCGTPCQIAALRLFLKKDFPKLFLIDFFCHGVPSQEYFSRCKEMLEKEKKIDITGYSYRTKKPNGVTPHYYTIRFSKNGRVKEKTAFYYDSPNYSAFQSYINLRESCYGCVFSHDDRYSDLTIGDFHEVEKYYPKINRFDGVSLVIVNTKKGSDALKRVRHSVWSEEIDLETLVKDRVVFNGGTIRPKSRDEFLFDYENMSFSNLNKKWFNKNKFFKQRLYYHLPKTVRKIVKRLVVRKHAF